MEVNIYVKKFKSLIKKIFEDSYELDRYYAEKLVKHLDDTNNDGAKQLLSSPAFSDLIFHSIENLQNVSTPNKILIADIMTVLVKNELQFNRLQSQGLKLCLLKKYMRYNLESQYPSMDLHYAYVKLSTAQLCHTSGLKAVIECKTWENVLCPDIHMKPAHVARACYEFISRLVWKLDEFEEEAKLAEILDFVMLPIKMSGYLTLTVFDPENERCISEPVITPLNTLLYIMSDLSRTIKSNYAISNLRHIYLIQEPLHMVIYGSRDHTVICLTLETTFRLYFALAAKSVAKQRKSDSDLINEMIAFTLNLLSTLMIEKIMVPAVIEFIVKITIFWSKEASNIYSSTFERNGLKFQVEDQLLTLAVAPLLAFTSSRYVHADRVVEKYGVKMGKIVCEHVIKSFYIYKMIIETKDMKKIATQAVRELFKLKGLLKATQAGMVFHYLYYVLEIYLPSEEEELIEENCLINSDDAKLLSLVLDFMKVLLVEHNIHWYENVEIVSLQNGLLNLLKRMTLPSKLLQQVLDLIELSVRKFLSPDMKLLVESRRGSTLDEVVAVMKSYIQHEEWEIRESAMSLLLSCTDVAFVKYVPLQKLILENDLILLASHAAFNDPECYVQVTALQCLASATRIEGIWRELMTANPNICMQLIYFLRNSPEGLIRKEVVKVLVDFYIYQKTSPQFEKVMFTVMSLAALDDLHWEVQMAALLFWKHVIKKLLSNKGMIDGKFPKVTFSKEKRKIIILDDKEVKKQLTNILNDLSDIGCLTVLHGCLNEEFNTEVMSYANCISTKLITILDNNGFDKCPETTAQHVIEPMEEAIKKEIEEDMVIDLSCVINTDLRKEQIIDEIVNTKLADLIMNLGDKLTVGGKDTVSSLQVPKHKTNIHPNKFLEDFRRTDYVNIIKSKNDWSLDNHNIDSLLDEILDR